MPGGQSRDDGRHAEVNAKKRDVRKIKNIKMIKFLTENSAESS
jgi:hypothetical protein